MLAFIALFFPAAVMVNWKRRLFKEEYEWKAMLMEYIAGVLVINFLVIAVAYVFFGSRGNVVQNINTYIDFASKYIFLSMVLAVILPWAWKNRKRVKFSVEANGFSKFKIPKHINIVLHLYAAVLFAWNLLRCFDNVVWGDEAYSVLLVRQSIPEIISGTAADVHPPLYYLWLKLFEALFGGAGWHIATLFTYGVILLIGIIWVRKKFGFGCAALFITFCTFLSSSVTYNVEIRMYSMAAMFILLSFVLLYYILRSHEWKYYILFAAAGLGAAYTHYFALFTVAFLYLFLLIYDICKKNGIKKIIVACVLTIAGYMPWMLVFIESLAKKVTDDYWITSIPTWKECAYYFFSGEMNRILLYIYIILILLVIAIDIFCINKETFKIHRPKTGSLNEDKNLNSACEGAEAGAIKLSLKFRAGSISSFSWWIIAGQFALFGTIAIGIIASNVIRPVFVVRYLFPATVIAWLVFAACLSKIKFKNIIALILTVILVIECAPALINTYKAENSYKSQIESILEETEEIDDESFLVTNISHLNWTVLEYYYPDADQAGDISLDITEIEDWDFEDEMWLFWSYAFDEETLEIIEDAGYEAEYVTQGSMSSSYYVYIYHLTSD